MKKNIVNMEGKVHWQSPSNIALIKYWGKYGNQLPKNPSISLTLKNSYSDTGVKYRFQSRQKDISFKLKFEGKSNNKFAQKIEKFLKNINREFSFLEKYHFDIDSFNTFPHSAGIASSAAFYSSLALCLCSIEEEIYSFKSSEKDFYRKASHIARLGSGSACRSVYGSLVLWGKVKSISNSSNQFAIPIKNKYVNKFKNYKDTILIVSSGEKKISSTIGHGLMKDNPYASARFKDAGENIWKLLKALKSNNQDDLINIIERDALSLHAMMMTSNPSFILFDSNTISIINEIRDYREKNKINICFTLDAGPNVHLLYPKKEDRKVMRFIKTRLLRYCEKQKYIDDEVGEGPRRIKY